MGTVLSILESRWRLGLGCLILALYGMNTVLLGVWEPWEAEAARIIDIMVTTGNWFAVRTDANQLQSTIAQLPYGWWPYAIAQTVFGQDEWVLRLPNLLAAGLLLYTIMRVQVQRSVQTAVLSVLLLASMPLFAFGSVVTTSNMLPQLVISWACLAVMSSKVLDQSRAGIALKWLALVLSGLIVGLVGLLLPLMLSALSHPHSFLKRTVQILRSQAPWVLTTGVALTFGWWLAADGRPNNLPWIQWLWFFDGLSVERVIGGHPAFSLYVHQLGFGLFPWSAFALIAVAFTLTRRPVRSEDTRFEISLVLWLVGTFLYGAITYSWTHHASFWGAPALALLLPRTFERIFERYHGNVSLIVVSVVILALLDSNLKHDPRLMAETLTGMSIEHFSAHVSYSGAQRALNFLLIGLLILFGTPIITESKLIAEKILFPKREPRFWSFGFVFSSLAMGIGVALATQRSLVRFMDQIGLRALMTWAKVLIAGALFSMVIHALVYILWRQRARSTERLGRHGTSPSSIDKLITWLIDKCGLSARWLRTHRQWTLRFIGVLACSWIILQQSTVVTTFTDNFSQRGLVESYREHKDQLGDDVPLFAYGTKKSEASYYSQNLVSINDQKFGSMLREGSDFFAVIPQKNLAKVNDRYRRAIAGKPQKYKTKHLPIIHDGGARFFLVSSRLPQGATDLNPMKSALLPSEDALPKDINRVEINFEDKVKIIGWKTVPKVAQRGSDLELIIYFKVLKANIGTWKVFIHIDAPGQRIHGDHDPVSGLLPTHNWRVGDLIADSHRVFVGRTKTPAWFTFYAGLFRGDKRMKVKEGPQDGKDRAKLGRLRLK